MWKCSKKQYEKNKIIRVINLMICLESVPSLCENQVICSRVSQLIAVGANLLPDILFNIPKCNSIYINMSVNAKWRTKR